MRACSFDTYGSWMRMSHPSFRPIVVVRSTIVKRPPSLPSRRMTIISP
jgi:hypothetical protein